MSYSESRRHQWHHPEVDALGNATGSLGALGQMYFACKESIFMVGSFPN
jgi:hypothetical protein